MADQKNAGKAHDATATAPAAPNWSTLVKGWNEKRKALAAADHELARLMSEHNKEFTVNGIGVLTGVKAKGKDLYYVKVAELSAPEEITL